jgi:cell division protein FtsB
MKHNRKREPLRVGTVSKSVLVCVCIAVVGVAYVWQKNQIYRLGDDLKKREAAFRDAEKRNTMLAAQLAQLKSPGLLEARCQQYGLGLVAPREQQMVRLPEPGPEWDVRLLAPVTAPAPTPKKPVTKVASRR